jgi:hypothetical protein
MICTSNIFFINNADLNPKIRLKPDPKSDPKKIISDPQHWTPAILPDLMFLHLIQLTPFTLLQSVLPLIQPTLLPLELTITLIHLTPLLLLALTAPPLLQLTLLLKQLCFLLLSLSSHLGHALQKVLLSGWTQLQLKLQLNYIPLISHLK